MEAVRVWEAELFEAWQRNEAMLRATCRAELGALVYGAGKASTNERRNERKGPGNRRRSAEGYDSSSALLSRFSLSAQVRKKERHH